MAKSFFSYPPLHHKHSEVQPNFWLFVITKKISSKCLHNRASKGNLEVPSINKVSVQICNSKLETEVLREEVRKYRRSAARSWEGEKERGGTAAPFSLVDVKVLHGAEIGKETRADSTEGIV